MSHPCGTVGYLAPEVVEAGAWGEALRHQTFEVGPEQDMWSFGVLMDDLQARHATGKELLSSTLSQA